LGLADANLSDQGAVCLSALAAVSPLAQGVGSRLDPVVGCPLDLVVVNLSVLAVASQLDQGVANPSVLVVADHSTTQEALIPTQ
jgi:hypothetical protein